MVEDQCGGLAGDLFHFGEHAAQFVLVGDPFGVAGGLAGGEPAGDGLAGDFAGELVVGAVRLGRAGLAAAAGLAAVGVAAGDAAGQGEADAAEPGGQGLVAAAQLRQAGLSPPWVSAWGWLSAAAHVLVLCTLAQRGAFAADGIIAGLVPLATVI